MLSDEYLSRLVEQALSARVTRRKALKRAVQAITVVATPSFSLSPALAGGTTSLEDMIERI